MTNSVLVAAHALGLQQQITEVLVATASPQQRFDITVDGFDDSQGHFGPAVVQNPVEVVQQHGSQFLEWLQALPAELLDPALEVIQHSPFVGVRP